MFWPSTCRKSSQVTRHQNFYGTTSSHWEIFSTLQCACVCWFIYFSDYIYTHKFIYVCKGYEKLSTQPKCPLEKLMYWLDVGKSVGLKPFQYQCVNMFYLYKSICAYILMHLYAYIYKNKPIYWEQLCKSAFVCKWLAVDAYRKVTVLKLRW